MPVGNNMFTGLFTPDQLRQCIVIKLGLHQQPRRNVHGTARAIAAICIPDVTQFTIFTAMRLNRQ